MTPYVIDWPLRAALEAKKAQAREQHAASREKTSPVEPLLRVSDPQRVLPKS